MHEKAWGFDDLERSGLEPHQRPRIRHLVGPSRRNDAVCRILATMLHELRRREGRYALETMCIGGGQGLAAVFATCSPSARRHLSPSGSKGSS